MYIDCMGTHPIDIPLSNIIRKNSVPLSPMHRAIEKIKCPKNRDVQIPESKNTHAIFICKSASFNSKAGRGGNGSSRFRKDYDGVSGGGRSDGTEEV